MLAQREVDRCCTMCGYRRWVGLIFDELWAVCPHCRFDGPLP